MFSQHQNLAVIWEHLLERHDIETILREIISQHALLSVSQPLDSGGTWEKYTWIKAIYDLQRCYLGGKRTDDQALPPEITTYMLTPELLLSSILYLIDAKRRISSLNATTISTESAKINCILTLTILSGLRLLLLHKHSISTYDIERLGSSLEGLKERDEPQKYEQCLVRRVFSGLLTVLWQRDHVDAYEAERSSVELPRYTSGLYPLQIRPEITIIPLMHGVAEEDEDWIDAYILLYDSLWAVECAIIQRYVHLRHHHGPLILDHSVLESDEAFEQLCHQRSSLIVSIFHFKGAMKPSVLIMEGLAVTLLDWPAALDRFLVRQDSLMQNRMSLPQAPTYIQDYGKLIVDLQPSFQNGLRTFATWLGIRISSRPPDPPPGRRPKESVIHSIVDIWVQKIAHPRSETTSRRQVGKSTPVYIVDCSKLHAVPKLCLAYQLRWVDRFAYESLQEDSPFLNWKEGVQCPSCALGEKIKCARLLEPLCPAPSNPATMSQDAQSQSQYSGDSSGSMVPTTASTASRSFSDAGSMSASMPGISTSASLPTSISSPSSDPGGVKMYDSRLPPYDNLAGAANESPGSPLDESLNIPIPLAIGSRLSVDLPFPVQSPPLPGSSTVQPDTFPSSTHISWNEQHTSKSKQPSRSARFASSMRRKSSSKEQCAVLSKDITFSFSASGKSLLLWSKASNAVTCFGTEGDGASGPANCIYRVEGVQAVALGNRKCAIITAGLKLRVYGPITTKPESEISLEVSNRSHDTCIAVSKDDKNVALSMGNELQIYRVEESLKRIPLRHQHDIYELRGAVPSTQSIPTTKANADDSTAEGSKAESSSWFSTHPRNLNHREVAEEQSQQSAVVSRKLYFSTDSQRLVVATQLGDHSVHVDIWDITREPVNTISENSRSFKLPPWVLNDGDLTGVFYDSGRRNALVTAFLGKEYPMLIPFPGYDALQNETYSTKIISAAQSPSGSSFIIANAMTEIIQFEYTAKNTLSPRKLKKASSKISTSVFKPGAIALAMPAEDVLQVFWIRDGKCMLRTIKLGITDMIKDEDIRPEYDRLINTREMPIVGRAPNVHIPELDA